MDGTAYWMEGAYEEEEPDADEKARQLEVEVSNLKRELAEVRKELAAKTVQLRTRDQADKAEKDKWAEARAQELAAAAAASKDQVIRSLEHSINQLEVALAQRTEELEESRRLYSSQKRALKDALSAAAEREAAEAAADEAGRSAATAAVEEEMERLHQELAQLQTRSALELRARETEIAELKQQLAVHQADKAQAVAKAEAVALADKEAALAAAEAAHQAALAELQRELSTARSNVQGYLREEQDELASDLASINKAKVQMQREFDAFKDLTAQTHRQHREEQARLLEENAGLKARIAAEAARVAMGGASSGAGAAGGPPGSSRLLGAAARGWLGGAAAGVRGKTFSAVGGGEEPAGLLEQWVVRLERQRKGLVPLLVVSSLVLLMLLIAVVRAGASARGEHKGALCFLAKLGIQIGEGCGAQHGQHHTSVSKVLEELVEATPRVKHVGPASVLGTASAEGTSSSGSSASSSDNQPADGGKPAAAGAAAGGHRRRARLLLLQQQADRGLLHSSDGGDGSSWEGRQPRRSRLFLG